MSNRIDSSRIGLWFFLGAMTVFAIQDGLSKSLALTNHPIFVVMIRYWAFALFVLAISARQAGGVAAAAKSAQPGLQILRGVMLAAQICLMTFSFAYLGLTETHAISSLYPLLIVGMGAVFLSESVGPRRWAAVLAGFVGVLIILRPGAGVFDPYALIPLLCAFIFAAYGILTRVVGLRDAASVSFFYTGVAGAVAMTLIGPFFAAPMPPSDWPLMAALCVTGALGHFFLIKAYEHVEASSVQPFAYWQLVLAFAIGFVVFDEPIDLWTVVGATLVVAAGLFALARQRKAEARSA
ncbi:MAG: DMT family transporter [Pseudomonadota bacterium]